MLVFVKNYNLTINKRINLLLQSYQNLVNIIEHVTKIKNKCISKTISFLYKAQQEVSNFSFNVKGRDGLRIVIKKKKINIAMTVF